MDWLFGLWDGIELWLVQLPYPLLVTLVLAVLLPAFWVVAQVLNRAVDNIAARLTRVADAEEPLSGRESAGVDGAR